ncbi:MAG: DEAD/DEAH box helicase family protein [Rhodospirillaceae bacterium]|nr:DEAD/DEAH box helicase family protein [Rhodospirillaceae bacterium]
MTGLDTLVLKTSYHKGRDDIANDFYLPAMRLATKYDRAVGYFRSTVFVIAWPALREFVANGGQIRILCSQVLSSEDIEALDTGYAARVDDVIAARLRDEVESLLKDEAMSEAAKVLAALVATEIVNLKIAILRPAWGVTASRIFHDKLGILRDAKDSVVIFKGSMNETWSGLAKDGNLESVDVACSWLGGRDQQRTIEETAYFQELWTSTYPGLDVRPFPETARDALVSVADDNWESTVERLLVDRNETSSTLGQAAEDSKGRTLRPHQSAGLAAWRTNGRRGILAFATGAGKTFTAIHAIRESLTKFNEVPVIVVPDKTLFAQWFEELQAAVQPIDARILRVGAGFDSWRGVIGDWTAPNERRVVLATIQTARSGVFGMGVTRGPHLFLVADEVHRLGSPANRTLLDETLFGPRLGLSATPERAGDDVGTSIILNYFGGVLEPRYTLADAIRDGVLTPYFYRPQTITLLGLETTEWHRLSRRIAQLRAKNGDDAGTDTRVERLLFARADIVKRAAAKVDLAVRVLNEVFERGQRWIVYCDDQVQLGNVTAALSEAGHIAMPFHSAMEGDRGETLRWLDRFGGIVVAIKCLDEGVDIPSVTHALILASSKNPREFVQRRGRVLRRAKDKSLAFVYDAIVVPPDRKEGDDAAPDPITSGELARAIEFAQSADNPAARADLLAIAIDNGINWETLTNGGVEDDFE